MPKRTDLETILIIGSGPIVIGQACEFDYSGTQACKALREEGYEVVLLNSNPATVMTDPGFAERTFTRRPCSSSCRWPLCTTLTLSRCGAASAGVVSRTATVARPIAIGSTRLSVNLASSELRCLA